MESVFDLVPDYVIAEIAGWLMDGDRGLLDVLKFAKTCKRFYRLLASPDSACALDLWRDVDVKEVIPRDIRHKYGSLEPWEASRLVRVCGKMKEIDDEDPKVFFDVVRLCNANLRDISMKVAVWSGESPAEQCGTLRALWEVVRPGASFPIRVTILDIFELACHLPRLRSLALYFMQISQNHEEIRENLFVPAHLESLHLSGPAPASLLAQLSFPAIGSFSGLRTLSLEMYWRVDGFRAGAHPNVETLGLAIESSKVGDERLCAVVESIPDAFPSLRNLNLHRWSSHQTTPRTVGDAICLMIRKLPAGFRHLRLSNNMLTGDVFGDSIVDALMSNRWIRDSLESLSIAVTTIPVRRVSFMASFPNLRYVFFEVDGGRAEDFVACLRTIAESKGEVMRNFSCRVPAGFPVCRPPEVCFGRLRTQVDPSDPRSWREASFTYNITDLPMTCVPTAHLPKFFGMCY